MVIMMRRDPLCRPHSKLRPPTDTNPAPLKHHKLFHNRGGPTTSHSQTHHRPSSMFLQKQTSIINILVFLWMSLSIRNLQLSVTHIQILSSLIRNQSVSERMRRSNLQPVSQGRDLKHKLVEMTRRTFIEVTVSTQAKGRF